VQTLIRQSRHDEMAGRNASPFPNGRASPFPNDSNGPVAQSPDGLDFETNWTNAEALWKVARDTFKVS